MITRKQWRLFCRDIRELLYNCYTQDVFLKGKRVISCDNDVIITSLAGEPQTVYTFEKSVKPNLALWELQREICFRTTLRGVKLLKNLTTDLAEDKL